MALDTLLFTKDFVFYTIQGEGKFVGYPSIFLRLSGCNLRCEWQKVGSQKTNLCDTAYSSHYPENIERPITEALSEVAKYKCQHVVITGGEPFLQKNLVLLVRELKKQGHFVTIETNGTIYFSTEADFISLSPKLESSIVKTSSQYQEHQNNRLQIEALSYFLQHHKCQLKFVVNAEDDLIEIQNIKKTLEAILRRNLDEIIYLMPQAITAEELQQKSLQVVEWAKHKGWRFADRLHLRLWGPKRGV